MRTYLRVGAIIFYKEKLLLTKMQKNKTEYYVLPGGGVEDYETIYEAINREVKEETSLEIVKMRPVYIRELNMKDKGRGVEIYFYVEEYNGTPQKGFDPEVKESSFDKLVLINPDELPNLTFHPEQLIKVFKKDKEGGFKEIKHLGLYSYP